MVQLVTQRQMRALKKLPFCYACGKTFTATDDITDDHVPPKACFAEDDRDFPLQLPAHDSCNSGRNLTDETIGQVVALKHGELPPPRNYRLEFAFFGKEQSQPTLGAVTNVDIRGEIRRWVRGFHAALYQEPLPPGVRFAIETPFPAARLTPNGPVAEPLLPQHLKFVEVIKLNRSAGNLDVIRSNNEKLKYECVWDQADDGRWLCVFALDLYSWKDLGDINNFQGRGCAGFYTLPSGKMPALATAGTKLLIRIPNYEPLDPFGK